MGREEAHIRVHGASRILGLGVDLLTEVGLENQIGDEVGHRQADRHQREQPQQEAEAQGHGQARGSRSTYPIPLTVWMRGGSLRSTFLRR